MLHATFRYYFVTTKIKDNHSINKIKKTNCILSWTKKGARVLGKGDHYNDMANPR